MLTIGRPGAGAPFGYIPGYTEAEEYVTEKAEEAYDYVASGEIVEDAAAAVKKYGCKLVGKVPGFDVVKSDRSNPDAVKRMQQSLIALKVADFSKADGSVGPLTLAAVGKFAIKALDSGVSSLPGELSLLRNILKPVQEIFDILEPYLDEIIECADSLSTFLPAIGIRPSDLQEVYNTIAKSATVINAGLVSYMRIEGVPVPKQPPLSPAEMQQLILAQMTAGADAFKAKGNQNALPAACVGPFAQNTAACAKAACAAGATPGSLVDNLCKGQAAPSVSVVTASQATAQAQAKGRIQAFDPSTGKWRQAKLAKGLSGFGAPTHVETVATATKDPFAAEVKLREYKSKTGQLRWYENGLVLAGIGLGVVAAGTGGYLLLRRK